MLNDPALSLANFHDLLIERGFTEVGCAKNKITLQGPDGGRMELPRQLSGRVFASHVERAARLLRISTHELLADADLPQPAATTAPADRHPPIATNEGAELVYQTTSPASATTGASAKTPVDSTSTRPRPIPAQAVPNKSTPARTRARQSTHISAVLTAMAEADRAMNFDSIIAACRRSGHDLTRDQVSNACTALARDGHLVRVRRGVYRPSDLAAAPTTGRVDIRLHTADPQSHAEPTAANNGVPTAGPDAHTSEAAPPPRAGARRLPADSREAWDRLFGADTTVSGPALAAAADWIAATNNLLHELREAS